MSAKRKAIFAMIVFSILLSLSPSFAVANPVQEYKAVVNHLKSRYKARKANLFFMWLARAAVSIAKPAGVKSFSLTVFQDLKFSRETIDSEMQNTMRQAYGPEWSEVFHVRSREGQQAYLYMKNETANVKVVLVTIDKENAAIVRATFSPDKVAEFINDPKILGIRVGDDPKPPPPAESN
jgi:hypothetical protein